MEPGALGADIRGRGGRPARAHQAGRAKWRARRGPFLVRPAAIGRRASGRLAAHASRAARARRPLRSCGCQSDGRVAVSEPRAAVGREQVVIIVNVTIAFA